MWLPIRPGTDLALALSIIHYLIVHDRIDHEFIGKHTLGYEKLRAEVLEKDYSLAWGAKITGLSREEIRKLAEMYVRTRKAVITGNAGLSHHTNAVQTHRAFYFLAAVTGHFGGKSMGYGCLNNGGCSTGGISLPGKMVPPAGMELCKNPVGWLESHENPVYPYKLRALISTGSPLTQWPGQSKIRQLMSRLDISVYNGLAKNINAYYFDYILPAATWIESGGLAPVSDDSRFVWVPVDPADVRKIMLVRNLSLKGAKTYRNYYFGAVDPYRIVLGRGGRDIMLEPPQKGAPLNYFMYPYAEADGRALDYLSPENFSYHIVFEPSGHK